MSEFRKFLLYEIPGLFAILYIFLLIACFKPTASLFIDFIQQKGNLQGLAVAVTVTAIPIGWLEFQLYDSRFHHHYKTKAFEHVKDEMSNMPERSDMQKECCHAVVDYILMKDFYKEFPGLGETIGGFWDHYKARRIVALNFIIGIPILMAFIISIIIISLSRFWIMIETSLYIPYIVFVSAIIFIFSVIIYIDARRIKKEVEAREYFLILKPQNKLKLACLKNKYKSGDFPKCIDP